MANDSSTGGFLAPQTSSMEDLVLNRFLRFLVVGITGMPGKTVVQRLQPGGQDINLPDFGTDWAAVGESERTQDTFAHVSHVEGEDQVYRNEILTILVSFYGPNARGNSNLLSMGFMVAQNRETLQANGYGFVDLERPVETMDMFNKKWVQRIDVSFRLRRSVTFNYPVLDLLGAQLVLPDGDINVTLQLPMFAWGPEGDFVAGWGSGIWTSLEEE